MPETSEPGHEAASPRTYYVVFAILLALLVLTVAAAEIRSPVVNNVVSLSIASAKAILIVIFFMHVRHATPLVRVVAAAGFLWLVLLIALTLSDFATRRWDRGTADQGAAIPAESTRLP